MIRSPLDNAIRATLRVRSWELIARAVNTWLAAHDDPRRVSADEMRVQERDGWIGIAFRVIEGN